MNVVAQPAFLPVDWWALGPLLALTLGILALLLLELVPQRDNGNRGGIVSLLTLAAAAWAALHVAHDKRLLFDGMFVHDPMTVFFTLLFCAIGALSVLSAWDYLKRTAINKAEYYALMLASIMGMIVMAASNDLITIFLGLELMSLSLYVMVGFRRSRLDSTEAALKYFLLGAFASGFLLYGIALLYGATGTTNLARLAAFVADTPLPGNPPTPARGAFVLAYAGDEVCGCGALRPIDEPMVELRRMFVRPAWRRQGVARALLQALEAEALRLGYATMRLETGSRQQPAIALYAACGFERIAPFGPYVGDPFSVCFEKALATSGCRPGTGT